MAKAISSLTTKVPQLAQAMLTQARPKLDVAWKYAKVELAPPTPGDIPKAIGGLRTAVGNLRSGRYKSLTVKEAWLNTLVAMEVCFWFYVGEVIGKRHLIGYKV